MAPGVWAPVVDIYETDEKMMIKAELPGLKKEDIDIEVRDNTLTLKGERKFEKEVRRRTATVSNGPTAASSGPSPCPAPSGRKGSRRASRTGFWRSPCPRRRRSSRRRWRSVTSSGKFAVFWAKQEKKEEYHGDCEMESISRCDVSSGENERVVRVHHAREGDEEEALVPRASSPAVDIYETDEKMVIKAELPGLKKEDIDIEVRDNTHSP